MDELDVPRAELKASLRFIRGVNRSLGGHAGLIRPLGRWFGGATGPVSVLDVGTGSADLPVAAVRWARARGIGLRVTGLDMHPTTLDLAREHVERELGLEALSDGTITLVRGDALEIAERFGVRSFDVVHAGMFLHHLSDIRVMTALRAMERVGRRGMIWNDLLRSAISRVGIALLTLGQPEIVREDGARSVCAGFTSGEVREIARRLELPRARVRANPLQGRFVLTSEWADASAESGGANVDT